MREGSTDGPAVGREDGEGVKMLEGGEDTINDGLVVGVLIVGEELG